MIFKTVIDTDKNAFDAQVREKTRNEYKIQDKIVIGYIGRLTEQKNTLFLIDIFNEIYKKESQSKLLIIGDGNLKEPMLEKIKQLHLEDQVLYLGRREDIQQFYNAMDCFLLPSLYEGLPVVGVEAETCGLPVFFSTEIPEESSACNELGFFISLNTPPSEWAERILDKTKKNMPVRKGYVKEVSDVGFDSKQEAKKLMDYYEKLIDKNVKNLRR